MKLFEEDPDTPAFNETLAEHSRLGVMATLRFSYEDAAPLEDNPSPLKMPKQRKQK